MDLKLLALSIALALPGAASAQQPATADAAKPRGEESEGFFRPSADIALNRAPPAAPAPAVPPTPPVSAPDTGVPVPVTTAPPAVERELERAELAHDLARQELARRPPPAVVSTLDGTAPIVSPLDGTAPIISPIGR